MCGITGFFSTVLEHSNSNTCSKMVETLRHRGPNASGVWKDKESNVHFGHTRLSIIDLSTAGQQPMVSSNGRWVIVYNGEIYNTLEIRKTLQASGISLRGHSDTEVVLEACALLGINATLSKLIGMFAFALWDKKEKVLYLARDRLGIKPLYWGRFGDLFLFGSELKALRAHPGWEPEVDRDALAAFMRHNYVPAPHSIYKGIYKLQPGSILTLKQDNEPIVEPYWEMGAVAEAALKEQFKFDDQEAIAQLEPLLNDAVSCRMVADVPLGALLSGGYDSSTVVALMQANSTRPIKTFSIGFNETGYDEAHHAKSVARHLGTDHTELYVTSDEARGVIPMLADMYDEPFADSSQIPTYLVSKLTRQSVTVALSGDGGDEVFAGYNRYFHGQRFTRGMNVCPDPLKGVCKGLIHLFTPDQWSMINKALPDRLKIPQFGDKMYKLAALLSADQGTIYRRLVSHWETPESLVRGASEPESLLLDKNFATEVQGIIERMQLLDTVTYLPDDILTKVDRASMATSLEARVPLLDHRLVEFAWRLPMHMKVRDGKGKWILRQVLYKHVPKALVERPKMGFGVPIGEWLRGPLREWAEALLNETKINDQGYLNYGPIKQKWEEHLSGERNWQYQLWNVLMFQAWYEEWMIKN
jgi:asparagine synthase (glutamine-hydrolysing)